MGEWQDDLEQLFGPAPASPGADEEPAKKKPRPRPARRRRSRSKLSRRALAARRANLRKARAAPRELIYRSTEKRRAASRANLQKALAARRAAQDKGAAPANNLKHGLYAYAAATDRQSLRRLGESPQEFAAHRRRIERLFAPQDDEEKRLVSRLADACWRRLRLFRAAARWEADRLKQILARAPRLPRLDAADTEDRAIALVMAFPYTLDAIDRESSRLNSQIEALLRALLRKRSNGAIEFKLFSPRRDPGSRAASGALDDDDADDLDALDDESDLFYELPFEELARRLQALPPDV